jgi:hypothetical protein
MAVNLRLFTDRIASSFVSMEVPDVLLALKIRLSAAVGADEAAVAPVSSVDQFPASFQDAPVTPLK